jgi:hypothetical protein
VSERVTAEWAAGRLGVRKGWLVSGSDALQDSLQTLVQLSDEGRQELIQQLFAAAELPGHQRLAALEQVLDLDGFCRFLAWEVFVGQVWGYAYSGSNCWIFGDPDKRRVYFLPGEIDGAPPVPLVSILLPGKGKLAQALLQTGEGRRRYLAALSQLATNAQAEARLLEELQMRAAALRPQLGGQAQIRAFESAYHYLQRRCREGFPAVREHLARLSPLTASNLATLRLPVVRITHPGLPRRLPVTTPVDYGPRFRALVNQPEEPAASVPAESWVLQIEAQKGVLEQLSLSSTNWVAVRVRNGEAVLEDVGLRLKGHGSREDFKGKPSFTLKFNWRKEGQHLNGYSKLHLHNSRADPSHLSWYAGHWLFQRAGMPCPRVGFASVSINGVDYGVFVVVEGTTRGFLERAFGWSDGLLFEGNFTDVDGPLDLDSGVPPPGYWRPKQLWLATDQVQQSGSLDPLRPYCDVEALARFVALEVVLGHKDGYAMAANNYRIYQLTPDSPFFLLPHGMDWLALEWDCGALPRFQGRLAKVLTHCSEGRTLYLDALRQVLTNALDMGQFVIDAAAVCRQIQSMLKRCDPLQAPGQLAAAEAFVCRLADRRAYLLHQLHALGAGRQATNSVHKCDSSP